MLPIYYFINYFVNTNFENINCISIFTENQLIINFENAPVVIYTSNLESVRLVNKCDFIVIKTKEPTEVLAEIETKLQYENESARINHRKYLVLIDNRTNLFQTASNLVLAQYTIASKCYRNLLCAEEAVIDLYNGKNRYRWFSKNSSLIGNAGNLYSKIGNVAKLRLATFTYELYSIPGEMLGLELLLVNEYARKYNYELEMQINEAEQWGLLWENFTGTGVFGSVIRREADLGLSAIFPWLSKYWYFEFSHYLIQTGVTCLVPGPRLHTGWFSIFPKYSSQLFIALLLTVAFSSTVLALIKKYENKKNTKAVMDSLTDLFKIAMLQSINITYNLAGKCIVMMLYALAMLLSSTYISNLSSSFTIPFYTPAIATVRDLVESKIPWVGGQADPWIESIASDETEIYIKLTKQFKEINITAAYFQEPLAFAVERLPSRYISIKDYLSERMLKSLTVMSEDLYSIFTVLIFPKNSLLLPSLNKFILQVQQAGLDVFWEKFSILRTDLRKELALNDVKIQRSEQELNLAHFKALFAVLMFGCVLAGFAFLIELYLYAK